MAHVHQRGAVRRDRGSAPRRARTLPLAALLLVTLVATARAQAPAAGASELALTAIPDLSAWWGEPGRPGYYDLAWLHSGFPQSWGGVAVGGWTREEPNRVRSYAPFPGFHGAAPQIATYDSIRFELGGAAARDGYESGLARAIVIPRVPAEPTTRAVVHLGGGSFGYDTNALAVERGDSTRLLRAEATALENRSTGVLDRSGLHAWQVAGRWLTKPARLDWGFGHRGAARYVIGGEEMAGGGESGYAMLTRAVGPVELRARFERGYDRRESFGGVDDFELRSRRDAQSTRGGLDATFPYRGLRLEARGTVGRDEVHRLGDGAFESSARWAWGSLATEAPFAGGVAELAAGLGHHGALGGVAPAVSAFWRIERGGIAWRGGLERAVRAAWTDLGEGEAPFLQSTWAGALAAERRGARWSWRAWAHGGRTVDRALVAHAPIEDLWLRLGLFRDREPYDFALTGGDLGWRRGRWSARGEGFVAYRSDRSEHPRTDPGSGARAELGYGFGLFGGDLQVGLRGGGVWVGSRESRILAGLEERTLPGYVTSEAALTLALGQAFVVIHGRNFENRVYEQPWLDTFNFTEALSTARELRFLFTVRLFN